MPVWLLLLLLAGMPARMARGQTPAAPRGGLPGGGGLPLDRPSERRLPPAEVAPAPPAPALEVPAPPPSPPAEGIRTEGVIRVFVGEYRFTGNTAFTAAELAEVTAPYRGREVAFEDLEAARHAVTLFYVDHGFVNSGAILPDQTIRDGVVTLQIVEGRLARIEIEGNRWFRERYLRDRLAGFAGPPLDANSLQRGLRLLLQDPRLEAINASLQPGVTPGEAVLHAMVHEAVPYVLGLDFDNHASPDIGSTRGGFRLAHQNLTGNGDVLDFDYHVTGGLHDLETGYSLPVTARDTTVSVRYHRSDATVITPPFDDLDIESRLRSYTLRLGQPLLRTLTRRLDGALLFEHRTSKTSLLGFPFSFSAGAVDGESTVTPLRMEMDWLEQDESQVLAMRAILSVGLDALGATENGPGVPDGEFFASLLQVQLARRLGFLDSQALFRFDLQLTPDRLLSLEQFVVGGADSVRGYRENQLVRDNGATGSLEWRVPVVRRPQDVGTVELAPFTDLGGAWLTSRTSASRRSPATPSPASQFLASLGLGIRWLVRPTTQLQVYWGGRLVGVENPHDDLQDYGVSFAVVTTFGPPAGVAARLEPWRGTRPGERTPP